MLRSIFPYFPPCLLSQIFQVFFLLGLLHMASHRRGQAEYIEYTRKKKTASIKYSIKFSFFAIIAFASPPNPIETSQGAPAGPTDARQLGVVPVFGVIIYGTLRLSSMRFPLSFPDFCSTVTQLSKPNFMFNRNNNILFLFFFFIVTLNVGQIVFIYLPKK